MRAEHLLASNGLRRIAPVRVARPALLFALGACTFLLAATGATSTGASTPTPARIVLDGSHPSTSSVHLGTFTAGAPLCSSGKFIDTAVGDTVATRAFTCADGSGTFTGQMIGEIESEHCTCDGGQWRIVAGTGPYAKLRGLGTRSNVLISGDPYPVFRDTWTGIVGLDAVPPSLAVTRVTTARVLHHRRTFTLRVVFSTADDVVGNKVTYALSVLDDLSITVARKAGQTAAGTTRISLVVSAPPDVHALRLSLSVYDPLGNSRSYRRALARLGP